MTGKPKSEIYGKKQAFFYLQLKLKFTDTLQNLLNVDYFTKRDHTKCMLLFI